MREFFPTPYPDECLYSILCRYYVRIGGAGDYKASKTLFGANQSLAVTILLPAKPECIDLWVPAESGITRFSLTNNHTMYPYFTVSQTPEMRTEIKRVLNGGIPSPKHDRRVTQKTLHSRLQYLPYCPLCATENVDTFGEAYWHRKHQLPGSYY